MADRKRKTEEFVQYILNQNIDDSVTPGALVMGIKTKDDSGGYSALTSTVVGSDQALDVNIVAGAGSGGTAAADDADFTAGTTQGTPAMGVYESSESSVTDGDLGIVGIDANRRMKVAIEADNVGIGGGTQYTEGDTDATITGTAAMVEGAADALEPLVQPTTPSDTQPISAASLPLPSGAATAANQQTDALTDTELRASSVPVVEDNSTAILADTSNMDANLATIAGDTTSLDGKDLMLGTDFSNVFGAASLVSATPAVKVEEQGTVAVDATGQGDVPVTLGGETVTVDLGANNDVTTELATDDLDTGAGTDTQAIVGIGLAESGGHALVGSANPMPVDGSGVTQPISASSLPLPTGASTSAKQDTIIGHVDGIEGLLGTIAGDTTSLDSKVITADTDDVQQATHDNLNANANIQVGDADVSATNPVPQRPNEYELAGNTSHVKKYYTSAGAATDGIIWSPAAGKRWYITDIFINVSAAATVTLEDDLAAGDSVVWKAELAANSGWSHSFTTPLYSGEDAADLIITTSAGNVYVTVTGYEI